MRVLTGYDAALAVTDEALTHGFQRLFAGASAGSVAFDIDPDHGKRFEATLGTPTVTFLSPDAAQVAFAITTGVYVGGEELNVRTKQIEEIKETLDGSRLAFTVDVARMGREGGTIHEADLSREQLYLDLTAVKAIDTSLFKLSIGAHDDVAAIVNGLVEYLNANAIQAADPDSAGHLVTSSVVVPTVRDPDSPFLPSAGAFSITLAPATDPGKAPGGDLNILLCVGDHPLPDPKAGLFDTPWTTRPKTGPVAHDGTLIISDHLLLDTLVRPMIVKAYAGASLTTDLGDATTPARLHLASTLSLDDDVALTDVEATVHDGKIDLLFHVEKTESLKIGSVDFSFVKVIIPHERRLGLQIQPDATGDVSVSVVSDVSTNLDVRLDGNFGVSSVDDVVKYLVVPLGVIYGTLAAAIEGVALLIKSLTTDQDELDAVQARFSTLASDLNVGIELPGSAVMTFTTPRIVDRVLMYDADYINLPRLRTPQIQPFMLASMPRLADPPVPLPHETTPQLVGETAMSFRMVSDPPYAGRQWREMPYYVLSRSQLWSLLFQRTWGLRDDVETITYLESMTDESSQSMEAMTNLRVTVGGKLGYKDFVSLEAATEISNELRMDRDDSQTVETETTLQKMITYTHLDTGYTEAIWTIVDRFELRRGDGYVMGTWDAPWGEGYWTADYWPHSAKRGDDGPALFDPTSFAKSIEPGATAPAPAGATSGGAGS